MIRNSPENCYCVILRHHPRYSFSLIFILPRSTFNDSRNFRIASHSHHSPLGIILLDFFIVAFLPFTFLLIVFSQTSTRIHPFPQPIQFIILNFICGQGSVVGQYVIISTYGIILYLYKAVQWLTARGKATQTHTVNILLHSFFTSNLNPSSFPMFLT